MTQTSDTPPPLETLKATIDPPMPTKRTLPPTPGTVFPPGNEVLALRALAPPSVLPMDDGQGKGGASIAPASTCSPMPSSLEYSTRTGRDLCSMSRGEPAAEIVEHMGALFCTSARHPSSDDEFHDEQLRFAEEEKISNFVSDNKEAIIYLSQNCYLCNQPLLRGLVGPGERSHQQPKSNETDQPGFALVSWDCMCRPEPQGRRITHFDCLRQKIVTSGKACGWCHAEIKMASRIIATPTNPVPASPRGGVDVGQVLAASDMAKRSPAAGVVSRSTAASETQDVWKNCFMYVLCLCVGHMLLNSWIVYLSLGMSVVKGGGEYRAADPSW